MKRIILIFVLSILVSTIFITQVDDDIDNHALDFLSDIDSSKESDAFLYLFGIYAAPNEDPFEIGKKVLSEHEYIDLDSEYRSSSYPESKMLANPTGDLFCQTWKDDCIKHLFESDYEIEKIKSDNKVLTQRAEKFWQFNEYSTLTKPSVNELVPPYQYLASAVRIKTLEAIQLHRAGKSEKAIDLLVDQFALSRNAMGNQDTLIGKLVFLMGMSEMLDVLSIFVFSSEKNPNLETMQLLTNEERGFDIVVAREFAMAYYMLLEADRHPEFFQIGGEMPGWMVRLFYKPNMTINASIPVYREMVELAKLSPKEFAARIGSGAEVRVTSSKIRNYAGNTLLSVPLDLKKYLARFFDFDAKITLFNSLLGGREEVSNATNPYYKDKKPVLAPLEACFDGPLIDERRLRCLRIGI